jgi:cobalamin biosynthesis protein CobD/CbiB
MANFTDLDPFAVEPGVDMFFTASAAEVENADIVILPGSKNTIRDSRKHASPNSGVPEAAMASSLGVRHGGPARYFGVLSDKPFLGDSLSYDYVTASRRALGITLLSSIMAVAAVFLVQLVRFGHV